MTPSRQRMNPTELPSSMLRRENGFWEKPGAESARSVTRGISAESLVQCESGGKRAADLRPGDLLVTITGELLPIVWKGEAHSEHIECIRSDAGILTCGREQRIVVSDPLIEQVYGQKQAEVSAESYAPYRYAGAFPLVRNLLVQFLLPRATAISADGHWASTVVPCDMEQCTMQASLRSDLLKAVPVLRQGNSRAAYVRPWLTLDSDDLGRIWGGFALSVREATRAG